MSRPPEPPHVSVVRPRWGHTTSLFQLGQPAFWLLAILLAGGGVLQLIIQNGFANVSPGGWALSWFLLALYGAPVFLTIYLLDLYEREPMSLVIGAFLWGALAAPLLSGIANEGWGLVVAQAGGPEFAARWTPALTAPWIEEIVKGAGIVLIYLVARQEIDDMMDGFVYGAAVGLGFTIVEDVFYFMNVFGGEPSGVLVGFFLRVIASGLYGHVLYSGLIGMGIAYFVTRRGHTRDARRWGVLVGLFALAVFAHFLWNSPLLDLFPDPPWTGVEWLQIPLATAVKGLPLLGIVVLLVRLAHRREHRWLEAALHDEVGKPGLLPGELEVLQSPRTRRRVRREMARRAGPGAARLVRRLHRQQINLAMVRTRTHEAEHPDVVRQREYVRSLRDALWAMPGAAPATRPQAP